VSIVEIYREVEDEFPNNSTEFLLEVTRQRVERSGTKVVKRECSLDEVITALVEAGEYKEVK
jgi:hypothetical protein